MKQFEFKQTVLVAAAGFVISVTGCTIYPERQDFGDSVRHMQTLQDASPDAHGLAQDGVRGQRILKLYREDVAKPAEIKNEIVINVGSGTK